MKHIRALLDMRVRDVLRTVSGYVFVAAVLCMPVAAEMLRAQP